MATAKVLVLIDGVMRQLPDGDSIEGAGDMFATVYDPQGIAADMYDRANHTGTQDVSTITGLGDAATLDVGTAIGTVAAGDHTHLCFGGDMKSGIYDPLGIEADAFDRANHHGTQTLDTISDAGDAAGMDVGVSPGTVAAGDHDHTTEYMDQATYNPQAIVGDVFDRANHTGTQPHTTIDGLGDAATKNVGAQAGDVAAGDHSHVAFTGATDIDFGIEGFVPRPHAGDHIKVLTGDGNWTTISDVINNSGAVIPVNSIPVMLPATDSVAGEKGLVPIPNAGEQDRVLLGNATWADMSTALSSSPVPLDPSTLPLMEGTDGVDPGESGVVPAPTTADKDSVLTGEGLWKTVTDLVLDSGVQLPVDAVPLMVGATLGADGEAGLVPQPMAGDQYKVLMGDKSWKTLSTAIGESGLTVPVDSIPEMEGTDGVDPGAKGLVPAQAPGDADKFLTGSATWNSLNEILVSSGESIPLDSLPIMTGATETVDGESGLVPTQPAGSQNMLLRGDATWGTVSEILGNSEIDVDPSVMPIMEGATASVAGAQGAVPEQLAGDEEKVLRGDATWTDVSTLLNGVTLPTSAIPIMEPASGGDPGTAGLVPAPPANSENQVLRGDATWADFPPNLNWQGEWDGATAYQINDCTQYLGNAYICIADNTGDTPPGTSWELLVPRGADGKPGPAGVGFDGYVTPDTIKNNTNNVSKNQILVSAANKSKDFCTEAFQFVDDFSTQDNIDAGLTSVYAYDGINQRYASQTNGGAEELNPGLANTSPVKICTQGVGPYGIGERFVVQNAGTVIGYQLMGYLPPGGSFAGPVLMAFSYWENKGSINGFWTGADYYHTHYKEAHEFPSSMGWFTFMLGAPVNVASDSAISLYIRPLNGWKNPMTDVYVGYDGTDPLGLVPGYGNHYLHHPFTIGNGDDDNDMNFTRSLDGVDLSGVDLVYRLLYANDPGSLISSAFDLTDQPKTGYLILDLEVTGTIDLGTNLTLYLSDDDGATWEMGTNNIDVDYSNGRYIISTNVEFATSFGTKLRWKLATESDIICSVYNAVVGAGTAAYCADRIQEYTTGAGITFGSLLIAPNLPTSSAGLPTGALWVDLSDNSVKVAS